MSTPAQVVRAQVNGQAGAQTAVQSLGATLLEFGRQGLAGMAPAEAADHLGLLLAQGATQRAAMRLHARRWRESNLAIARAPFLDELAARAAEKGGPLALKLPRAPGAREQRWTHLLCGPVDLAAPDTLPPAESGLSIDDTRRLDARIQSLEGEVARLRSALQDVCNQLGMDLSQHGHPEANDRA